MGIKVGTWIFWRGKDASDEQQLAALTISAAHIKVVPVSQYIELRDRDGVVFATITWPSTTNVRKTGA